MRSFLLALLLFLANPAAGQSLADPASATLTAPDIYKVRFETTAGEFTVKVNRRWAPLGADRFYNLIKVGYYDNTAFFRVIRGFMVQFGLNGDAIVSQAWKPATILDDPSWKSNKRGRVTFAMSGKDSRTTQIFINYGDNSKLDDQGFTPIGKVVSGMKVVNNLYSDYGEGRPRGMGPDQSRVMLQGSKYLRDNYPRLDWIESATILE